MQKIIFLLIAITPCGPASFASGTYDISKDISELDGLADIGIMQEERERKADRNLETIKYHMTQATPGESDTVAAYNLGVYYERGESVIQDMAEAAKWYALAAGEGHAKAQSSLGLFYENGFGVAKDLNKAVELYRLAAIQGDDVAQLNLGLMTVGGNGVPKSRSNGLILIGLAARGGNLLAKENLSMAGSYYRDLKFAKLLDACLEITLVKCFQVNEEHLLEN